MKYSRGKNPNSRNGFKKGDTTWNKGKSMSDGMKKKMQGNKNAVGRTVSLETRKKIGDAQRGEKNHMYGITGANHPSWKESKASREYPVDWTETLRRSIRERDKYTCQLCSKQQGDISMDVHHIDYNKQNCNPNNLVSLCRSCHIGTNSNRSYWKELLAK